MDEKLIDVTKTAKYITVGELTKKTKYIWIALHGYGQLAKQLAAKFKFLNTEEHFIICPEGLNKFYWHKNNEPVACWMTKDNRYAEISNFVTYLDTIYSRYCMHVNVDTKIILFGFSQGCASVWRWIHASRPRFDALINWAGWIPEDISYLHLYSYLEESKITVAYGDQDEYLTEKIILELKELSVKNKLKLEFFKFEGTHRIPGTILENSWRNLV